MWSNNDLMDPNWKPLPELEPKPKKKVKLYSPIIKSTQGYRYIHGRYTDTKEVFLGVENIIGWHEIEVEVDE